MITRDGTYSVPEGAPTQPSIRTIARNTPAAYDSKVRTNTKNNTGFALCQKLSKEFLSKDLLKDILDGMYKKNPRIDVAQVLADRRLLVGMNEQAIQDRWSTYWDKGMAADKENCYRSTLIVPMTLVNNRLKYQFLQELRIPDTERAIFGFLCFDHWEPSYFIEPDDVDFGYFLADILSLYQVVALGFTTASQTYSQAQQRLTEGK